MHVIFNLVRSIQSKLSIDSIVHTPVIRHGILAEFALMVNSWRPGDMHCTEYTTPCAPFLQDCSSLFINRN